MATYTTDKVKYNGNIYKLQDSGALQLTGGTVTGPVTFNDSVSMDEATVGDLVVNGNLSTTNNIQANTINGVSVGSSPKFTDTVTTASTTGSGNAVTSVTASNGVVTVTKGTTFLTSHQDISGKADKSATVSTVAYDSTNKKLTKTINGTTSDVVTVATLKTALSLAKGDVGLGNVENKSSATIRGELTKDNVTSALGYTPPTTNTTYSNATTSVAGLMSSDDKSKLNGIASGAEVNQNAFSNVKVGSTTVAADGKTDTLELAGSNVTLTPDATNDKVTIGITKDNVTAALGYTPPTTNTTYSNATTSAAGLMSSTDKSKLDGIAAGAQVNTVTSVAGKTGDVTLAKGDVGLGNVGNFKAVSTAASQGLTDTEKSNARANIGAGTSSFNGAYSSLSGKPTLGTASAKDVPSSGNASTSQVVMGNDTRLTNSRPASDVSAWAKASSKPSYTASEVGAIPASQKGAASGVAELDANGLVPASQLPSYVDDILEYTAKADFPSTGETGKIYVDTTTNLTYRWSGTAYVEISASLALGTTSSTAFRGDYGNTAYAHATDSSRLTTAKSSGLYKIATTAQGHIASVTAVAKSDITGLGIPAQDTTYSDATTSTHGLMSTSDKSKLNGIASGAEVNQNAFSNVKVGSTTVAADGKTDTLELAGSNVTLTPDATNDKVTIGITKDNVTAALGYTPPTTNTTYSNATTSAAGLMSSSDKSKLDGIAAGAQVNSVTSVAGKTGAVALAKGDVGLGNVDNTADSAKSVAYAANAGKVNNHTVNADVPSGAKFTDTTYGAAGSSLGLVKSGGDVSISSGVIEVNNNSHNHELSTIYTGSAAKSGDIDPVTASKIGSTASNKSFGLPASAIKIEYSTNGGSSWTDYGATDAQKRDLFNETRGTSFCLGKATSASANNVNNRLRVTIEPTDRYTSFHGIYVWMSTNGNTVVMDLERSTIGAKDTFTTVFTGQAISGWSGNNIRYFSEGQFGGGSSQTSNYYKYRITFRQTAINSSYPSANIIDIRFIGNNVWSSPNTMVSKNRIYDWDRDLNVTFPAGVNATKFNNHTINADVPSGAKFTDTVTTASTTGSGNAVTSVTASNGVLTVTKGTTFLTSHQDISGKADKSATVSTVSYDTTNKKITKTINGTTSDVVTVATLKSALSLAKSDVGLGNVENKSSATIRGELTKDNVTTALGYTPPTTNTTYSAATTSAAGLMSASDKSKLDGIASGAEVNQNAFSNVKVGSTTVAADGKTDTLELVGSNVTLTPDATNDKVTIGITKANVTSALGYTPPTTNTTYSNATTSAAGLMSSTDKSKLDGIAAGAQVNAVTSVAGKTGAVTLAKSDVGLGNVENKSSATIRGELTSSNVTTALGFVPKIQVSTSKPSYNCTWFKVTSTATT